MKVEQAEKTRITYLSQQERECHSLLVRQWSMWRDSDSLQKVHAASIQAHQEASAYVDSFVSLPLKLCADTTQR